MRGAGMVIEVQGLSAWKYLQQYANKHKPYIKDIYVYDGRTLKSSSAACRTAYEISS